MIDLNLKTKAMKSEEIKEYSSCLLIPVYLLQGKRMKPCNPAASSFKLTYRSIAEEVENAEDAFSCSMNLVQKKTTFFCTIQGKKISLGKGRAWLITCVPNISDDYLQELYRLASAREIMLEMTNSINQLETDQDIYEFILENCRKAVELSDLCSLMLVSGDIAHVVAARGYGESVFQAQFKLEDTFLSLATKGRMDKTVIISDLARFADNYHTEIKTKKNKMLLKSTLSTPIYVDKKLYAILCFDSTKKNSFTEQDKNLLELVKTNVETTLSNHLMHMQILHMSKTDQLTGVNNRTYLTSYLRQQIQKSFYLAMIDMNDLKGINDGHGHSSGDFMIQTMADTLRDAFPQKAEIFRLGGDEFIGVIHGMGREQIQKTIEEVKNAAKKKLLTLPDGSITTLSFSCGLAYHKPNAAIDPVMSEADHEMYEEKRKLKAIPF